MNAPNRRGSVAFASRMTRSGFCEFPTAGSHEFCHSRVIDLGARCSCECHGEAATVPSAATDDAETAEEPATVVAIVNVPARFYDDHRDRGCGLTGVELKRSGSRVVVQLDREAYTDLRSDAELYDEGGSEEFEGLASLCKAARATLRALDTVANQFA